MSTFKKKNNLLKLLGVPSFFFPHFSYKNVFLKIILNSNQVDSWQK